MDCQLEEVLGQLVGPSSGSSGEGVVLDELIKEINSSHVAIVVTDDSRPLDLYLLVNDSASNSFLRTLYNGLVDGFMAGGDHGH